MSKYLKRKNGCAPKWVKASLVFGEEMEQRYALEMTHLKMGPCLKDRAHLERAKAISGEIAKRLTRMKSMKWTEPVRRTARVMAVWRKKPVRMQRRGLATLAGGKQIPA
jgi:hypothetical protein